MKRNIPFSPPDITEEEINEVIDALRSSWITTGPKTKQLEKLIAERCNTSKAVCLNSNTACSEMTLRILGIGPGDEVIVPAYTYTASASVIGHVGAKIVMVDCEPGKFTMDYDKLENAITERTKVIIPVDLFGIPCDYKRIIEIAKKKRHLFHPSDNKIQKSMERCIILADAAHSFGACYKNIPTGSLADFTCFSFHAVKNLTTAEGGAVVWRDIEGINNEELYHQYMLLSLHGQDKDALAKTKAGGWEYDIKGLWYKCNMTDVCAAIGLAQMRRYDSLLLRRKSIIEKYNEAFRPLSMKLLNHYSNEFCSSGHLYVIRLFNQGGNALTAETRNHFIAKLAEMGVAANVHYKPLPMHSGYMKLGFDIKDYPNAFKQFQNAVTLPLYSVLSDDDAEYVIECVKKLTS